jgi:hypothetical protein
MLTILPVATGYAFLIDDRSEGLLMIKRNNCFCACVATLLMFTGIRTQAGDIFATFEGYAEGSLGTTFTESNSGIVFTNPIYSLGPNVFITEYGSYDSPYNFPMFPGMYLTVAAQKGGQASPPPSQGSRLQWKWTCSIVAPKPQRP